jgi:hypothetical protein
MSSIEARITSSKPRPAVTPENKIETNRIHKNYFHRPMIPSTLQRKKSGLLIKNERLSSKLVLNETSSNRSRIRQDISTSPHTNLTFSRSSDKEVTIDIGMSVQERDQMDESYEDLEIDLIARDIRHFDNYSNISSLNHR